MEKKNNNKKVDPDVKNPKRFIMKFEFKDGVVFPREVELIKDCFEGNECFDPKEFTIEGNEVVVKGDYDWDKSFENVFKDERNVRWFDILTRNVIQIFHCSGCIQGDTGSTKEEHRFRFCGLKIKLPYWLKYIGELVSE